MKSKYMKKTKKLLIIGAGQYGMVAKEIAEELGYHVTFLDKSLPNAQPEDFGKFEGDIIIAIGNPEVKRRFVNMVGDRLVSLISPHAYVSPQAEIALGCVIEPMTVIHTGVKIERGCFISAGAVINHNCEIGEFSHIDCNATVLKSGVVPAGMKIDSNKTWTAGRIAMVVGK